MAECTRYTISGIYLLTMIRHSDYGHDISKSRLGFDCTYCVRDTRPPFVSGDSLQFVFAADSLLAPGSQLISPLSVFPPASMAPP